MKTATEAAYAGFNRKPAKPADDDFPGTVTRPDTAVAEIVSGYPDLSMAE